MPSMSYRTNFNVCLLFILCIPKSASGVWDFLRLVINISLSVRFLLSFRVLNKPFELIRLSLGLDPDFSACEMKYFRNSSLLSYSLFWWPLWVFSGLFWIEIGMLFIFFLFLRSLSSFVWECLDSSLNPRIKPLSWRLFFVVENKDLF